MFSMFNEIEIIKNLETIIESMKENQENKMMLYTFILETNKEPVKCECKEGMDRLHCPKCNGTGYYLVEKVGEDK